MSTRVTFNKDYETLFQSILNKFNQYSTQLIHMSPTPSSDHKKQSPNQQAYPLYHQNHLFINLTSNTPQFNQIDNPSNHKFIRSQNHQFINSQYRKINNHLNIRFNQSDHISLINNDLKPIKQSNYMVLGQSSVSKSLQLRKTFVNLGNSRYQIKKSPEAEFNKSQTFFLRNLDLQKSTCNANTIAFPIITQKSKQLKDTSPISINRESTHIKNPIRSLTKRKRNQLTHSIQLTLQTKSFHSKTLQNKQSKISPPQIIFINPEKQKPAFKSISSLSKSVDLQPTQFLKQMTFTKQYEKKLHQIQSNISEKRRQENVKQKRRKKQKTEKDHIDPWKYQNGSFNTPQDIQQIFDRT